MFKPIKLSFVSLFFFASACQSVPTDDDNDMNNAKVQTPYLWPKVSSELRSSVQLDQQVKQLLATMTLPEKIGQMVQGEISNVKPFHVKKYHLGSVLNGGNAKPYNDKKATVEDWLEYADDYYKASISKENGRVAIPLIWGTDAVHGHNQVFGATVFPHNIGLGAANNPQLMQAIGEVTAKEVRVTGQDWTFAPTLAVAKNDRWGRTYESYSEDPAIVHNLAAPIVRGLQGDARDHKALTAPYILATAKHFIGDGGTVNGDDQGDNVDTERQLIQQHLPGYLSAIKAGVQTVMVSYSSALGQKMHANKYLLTDVLRQQMGFDGFIIGDWDAHAQIPGCSVSSCPAAINAGIDMLMVPNDWRRFIENTIEDVEQGRISQQRIDEAVFYILRVKMRAGLFDTTLPSKRPFAGQKQLLASQAHRDVARQAVRESLVLLKNQQQLLPLDRNLTVMVAGASADNKTNQMGGWSLGWQSNNNKNSDYPNATSVYQGIKKMVDAAGGQAYYSRYGEIKQGKKPDVAIYVFGETPYAEMQGDLDEDGRLGSVNLMFEASFKDALLDLEDINAQGIPIVGVFLSGRALVINQEMAFMDALVAAWLPGSEGDGIAEVLFKNSQGEINYDFKGKLSFSWPKEPAQDELNIGQSGYDPLFPLGYGMTYQ